MSSARHGRRRFFFTGDERPRGKHSGCGTSPTNAERRTENGERRTENGERRTENDLSSLSLFPEPLRQIGDDVGHDRDGGGAFSQLERIDLVDGIRFGVVDGEIRTVDFK
jgi:hypothetical protein